MHEAPDVAVIVVALLATLAISLLLGSSTLVEQRQMRLAYESEFARLILVLGLTTFICFHVRRMYDTREIEAILARPISRRVFVLAYYAAFSVVALVLCLILVPLMIGGLGAAGIGFAEWEASLMLECLILVAMSLFDVVAGYTISIVSARRDLMVPERD